MLSPGLARVLRPLIMRHRLAWVAYTATVPLYGALTLVLLPARRQAQAELNPSIALGLNMAVLLLVAVAVGYRRWSRSQPRLRRQLQRPVEPERLARQPRSGATDAVWLRGWQELPLHEQRFVAFFAAQLRDLLINLALNEAVVLIGFVLAMVTGTALPVLGFGLLALGLNVWMWPDADRLYAQVQPDLLAQAAAAG